MISFLSPTWLIFPLVFTSNEDGTDSTIVIGSVPTNDSISMLTSNEFGLFTGSILLWAVLIISNSTNDATLNVVLKFVLIPLACALISMV